jgi:predicted RNA binding protein YcfA (HicA-like mRNA interferase family)
LKENNFVFSNEREGSHEAWKNTKTQAMVDINFHGQKSFRPRTLETMIRQSKIDKKVWRDWASR